MTIYRHRWKSDVWHWRQDCSQWPIWNVNTKQATVTHDRKPTTGEMCNQCRAKAKRAKEKR